MKKIFDIVQKRVKFEDEFTGIAQVRAGEPQWSLHGSTLSLPYTNIVKTSTLLVASTTDIDLKQHEIWTKK